MKPTQKPQIVELVNPSDAITFILTDVKTAGVAILILGRGAYGLNDSAGETVVPLMLFGGSDAWLVEQKIKDLSAFTKANGVAMAEFLETCCYGTICEREALGSGLL